MRYPARHALSPIINSLGFDLNRIFNELPVVALILTLTEAGSLLIEALGAVKRSTTCRCDYFLADCQYRNNQLCYRYYSGAH